MPDWAYIALATVIFLAYGLIKVRLTQIFQPLRMKIAEDIEDLIADETIPDRVRDDLDMLGKRLFSTGSGWLFILTFPLGVYYALKGTEQGDTQRMAGGHPRRKDVSQAFALGIFCMIATSPIAVLIFAFEFLLLIVLFVPLGRGARQTLRVIFDMQSKHPPNDHATAG